MLHHVDGERLMINCGYGGRYDSPDRDEATHKREQPPNGDEIWVSISKIKPASQVNQRCDYQRKCDGEEERQRLHVGMGLEHG